MVECLPNVLSDMFAYINSGVTASSGVYVATTTDGEDITAIAKSLVGQASWKVTLIHISSNNDYALLLLNVLMKMCVTIIGV